MTNKSPNRFDKLREKTEDIIKKQNRAGIEKNTGIIELIDDLEIHQAELEDRCKNLHATVDNTEDLIWSIDRSYCLVISNRAFLKAVKPLYGRLLEPGDLLIDTKKIAPGIWKHWKTIYDRALSGERFTIEFSPEAGGSIFDFSFNPIYDAGGNVTGVAALGRDITDKKNAEKKLTHSHDLMTYIIEHNNSAVAVHDTEMRYIYVSQNYLEQYGVEEKNIIVQSQNNN